MPPVLGIDLSTSQKREFHEFMEGCRKAEYRRAVAIMIRSDGVCCTPLDPYISGV